MVQLGGANLIGDHTERRFFTTDVKDKASVDQGLNGAIEGASGRASDLGEDFKENMLTDKNCQHASDTGLVMHKVFGLTSKDKDAGKQTNAVDLAARQKEEEKQKKLEQAIEEGDKAFPRGGGEF